MPNPGLACRIGYVVVINGPLLSQRESRKLHGRIYMPTKRHKRPAVETSQDERKHINAINVKEGKND